MDFIIINIATYYPSIEEMETQNYVLLDIASYLATLLCLYRNNCGSLFNDRVLKVNLQLPTVYCL